MKYVPSRRGRCPLMIIAILAISFSVCQAQSANSSLADLNDFRVSRDTNQAAGRRFIIPQLLDDISYLAHQSDFYAVVGGLGLIPSAFGRAFQMESPEFTENWGGSQFADNFLEGGEVVGDARFPVLLSAGAWGIGRITGSSRLASFGSDLFRAQVIDGLLTVAMKGAVNRKRPNGGAWSYPSGHTSSAFTTAGTIYAHFGRTWGIPAFLLAGYVGLSRLQEGKHYFSDVVAGGILGSYVSLRLAHRGHRGGALTVAPASMGDGLGLSVALRF